MPCGGLDLTELDSVRQFILLMGWESDGSSYVFPIGCGVSECVSISRDGKWLVSKGLRKCFQCFRNIRNRPLVHLVGLKCSF